MCEAVHQGLRNDCMPISVQNMKDYMRHGRVRLSGLNGPFLRWALASQFFGRILNAAVTHISGSMTLGASLRLGSGSCQPRHFQITCAFRFAYEMVHMHFCNHVGAGARKMERLWRAKCCSGWRLTMNNACTESRFSKPLDIRQNSTPRHRKYIRFLYTTVSCPFTKAEIT